MYLKKRTANIHKMPIRSPMLAIKGAPADYDTQTCSLRPMVSSVSVCHFFHRLYIVAIPYLEVVSYLRSWHLWPRTFIVGGILSGSQKKTFQIG